jgi:hypothetical protein
MGFINSDFGILPPPAHTNKHTSVYIEYCTQGSLKEQFLPSVYTALDSV